MEEYLKNNFGEGWYNQLKDILTSDYFTKLGQHIAALRDKVEIYPKSEWVFRAFKLTPYEDVKVIILAMDPYNSGPDQADGLAFSNSEARYVSPSVRNIMKEVEDEFPEWKGSIEHGRLGWVDLRRWAKQGVFLYNTALTVEKNKAGSHIKLWKPFTKEVIKALNRKHDLVWILMGNEAQKFESLIVNPSHAVLKCAHPAAESYRKNAGFFGSGVFRKANEELEARNKKIIYW